MPLVLPNPHCYARPTVGQIGKSALVFGDSQTEFMGEELAKILRADGYAVQVDVNKGFTSAKLYDRLQDIYDPAAPPEIVFIFAGGNDARKNRDFSESVASLIQYANPLGSTRVFWVGPPPQTRIGSSAAAKAAFGISRPVGDPHWLKSTPQREAYNAALKTQVEQAGATFLDVRDAGLGGSDQAGVTWPDQPDGVHTENPTAKSAAQWIFSKSLGRPVASIMLPLVAAAALALVYIIARD